MPELHPTSPRQFLQVESECQCEREKRAQAAAKEAKEVHFFFSLTHVRVCSQGPEQVEARLSKAEKEEIDRMKVFFITHRHSLLFCRGP